jgi:hypothetical protein
MARLAACARPVAARHPAVLFEPRSDDVILSEAKNLLVCRTLVVHGTIHSQPLTDSKNLCVRGKTSAYRGMFAGAQHDSPVPAVRYCVFDHGFAPDAAAVTPP